MSDFACGSVCSARRDGNKWDGRASGPAAATDDENKSFIFDAEEIDTKDRAEFVRHVLASKMVPIELHWPDRHSAITARGIIADLGDLTLCSGYTSSYRVKRTPALARDSTEPCIIVNVQVTGTSIVAQEGRQAVSRHGDLVIHDSTAPYEFCNGSGISGDFFRIPHSALALPPDLIRQACAVALSPGHPITSLTFEYLRRLASDRKLVGGSYADLVGHPSVELIRAVIATHLRDHDLAATSLATSLCTRVLEYASANLHDPDLSGEQIAAAHYISVRYLYKVMAESGLSLAHWIRTQRLDAVRRTLTHASANVTIAAVARRYGFSDMSSFSRAFRAEFGITPREWRGRQRNRDSLTAA